MLLLNTVMVLGVLSISLPALAQVDPDNIEESFAVDHQGALDDIEDQSGDALISSQDSVYQGNKVSNSDLIAKATYQLVGVHKDAPLMHMTYCTATLIANDILLTAGHCIKNGAIQMYARYQSGKTRKLIKAVEFLIHKKYSSGKHAKGGDKVDFDLALIRLEKAVPGGVPAALPREDLSISPSQKVLIAGYGMNGHTLTKEEILALPGVGEIQEKMKSNLSEAEKMKLTFELINLVGSNPLLSAEIKSEIYVNNKLFKNPMLMTSGSKFICGGDSGGPSFLRGSTGLVVVGVHSLGVDKFDKCEGKSTGSSFWHNLITRGNEGIGFDSYVPQYLGWIKASVKVLRSRQDI